MVFKNLKLYGAYALARTVKPSTLSVYFNPLDSPFNRCRMFMTTVLDIRAPFFKTCYTRTKQQLGFKTHLKAAG